MTMTYQHIEYTVHQGIATMTLNRPDVLNAMDETTIAEMHDAVNQTAADDNVRALVLRANGKAFCAGGDLNWMRRAASYSQQENIMDAKKLGDMLYALHQLKKPTIAMVHGAVYGGGVGVVGACDIALGLENSRFCLSEVKIGLVPSIISPYVLGAMGARQARRFYLTAEVIAADKAQEVGLLHEVYADEVSQNAALADMLKLIKRNAPEAMGVAKDLIYSFAHRPLEAGVVAESSTIIAKRRATPEAKEGINAFLEKRSAAWVEQEVK